MTNQFSCWILGIRIVCLPNRTIERKKPSNQKTFKHHRFLTNLPSLLLVNVSPSINNNAQF
ncbi:hypothetical protein CsatB_003235 [Cannabis sativa]